MANIGGNIPGMPGRQRPLSVDDLVCHAEGRSRPLSGAAKSRETSALLLLSQAVERSPESAIQQLTQSALSLTEAESAGVTLETLESDQLVLRWIAIAGKAEAHQGGMMPRDFSPCGEAMNRRRSLMPGR